jgi:hypothetical protein
MRHGVLDTIKATPSSNRTVPATQAAGVCILGLLQLRSCWSYWKRYPVVPE